MIRDHRRDGFGGDLSLFKMYNLVKKFGTETEYVVIKFILRIFYKEIVAALDEKGKRIPGKIKDERLQEMIYIMEKLIHDYYFLRRFDK